MPRVALVASSSSVRQTVSMIEFFTDGVAVMPPLREQEVKAWLEAVAEHYDKHIGTLCYEFCTDERILSVNREFLDHDYYTDIITFDYTKGRRLGADIVLSLDTVASNAEMLGTPYSEELHRVIVHGLLHLVGLKDKTDEDATKMRAAEDEALALLRHRLGEGSLLAHI